MTGLTPVTLKEMPYPSQKPEPTTPKTLYIQAQTQRHVREH